MVAIAQMLAEDMNRIEKVRKAEVYLCMAGITKLQSDLWEAAQFEMNYMAQCGEEWTHLNLAKRYIEFLRDRVHASSLKIEKLNVTKQKVEKIEPQVETKQIQQRVAGRYNKGSGM